MNDITTTRMLLTTAVLAAVAALIAAPANAVLLDVEGGGGGSATTAPAPQIEPGTIPYLSHGIGVDASLFGGTGVDTTPAPGTIPYLSHGIGVDASLFGGTGVDESQAQGRTSLGLTGDGALTRGEVFQAGTGTTAKGSDVDWSRVGVGAGMAALLAAVMTGLYLSARRRSRVALP